VHGLSGIKSTLDVVEPGGEEGCQEEMWVGGVVTGAKLDV